MKAIVYCGRLAALCLAGLVGSVPALAQETGSITGRVSDLGGAPYVGAEVTVTDLGLKTMTDEQGRYRILGVAAGSHPVEVIYLSAATATETAEVKSGETLDLDCARGFCPRHILSATALRSKRHIQINEGTRNAHLLPQGGYARMLLAHRLGVISCGA